MSPAERARWLRTAAQWLPTVPALAGTAGAPFVAGMLEQMARAQAAPLTFRKLSPTRWLIGTDSPAEFEADLMGLRAAWAAIDGGRHVQVHAAEFAAPDARRCEGIVRRAIRETAAHWARHEAQCPALADVLASMQVKGGRVLHRRSSGWPEVITR